MATSLLYQPSPRFFHCAAQVGEKAYLWGGRTQNFSLSSRQTLASEIQIFDVFSETWKTRTATGAPPTGLYDGACTVVSETLYHFGGQDGHSPYNTLHCLDTLSLNWRELHGHAQNPADQPMPKIGCGLVTYTDKASLALFAGFGIPRHPTQPGSRFVQDTNFTNGNGWTNELHLFNLTNGEWTSPPTTGSRPPPCAGFSFTAINHHMAVMFGGYHCGQGGHGRVNDVYIIDFRSMEWTKLERPEGAPWPVERTDHAACCLNYGDDLPQLLVTGGLDENLKTLNDAWLLDINHKRWRELTLPEGTQPRYGHTVTSFRLDEDRVHAITFGGCPSDFDPNRSFDDDPKLADTTVMEFESLQSSSSAAGGPPTSEWVLMSVVGSRGLGTPERLKKLEEIRKRKTEHALKLQVEKALKSGHIITDLTTCLASGPPGSGKTHVRFLLYGLIPPTVRISTACIEEAQRAVINSLDSEDSEESQWKPVHSGELKEMVAEGVSAGVEGIQDQIPSSTLHQPDKTPFDPDTAESTQVTSSKMQNTVNTTSQAVQMSASDDKPQVQHTPDSSAHTKIQPPSTHVAQKSKTDLPRMQALELPETSDILELMKTFSTTRQPLQAHWMHFIDSGGQPQFLEILPAFIRNVSLLLLLVKLSEELSDTPTVEYFSPDGKSCELGVFPLSNEQLLVQAAQLSLFHQSQISLPQNIIEKEQSQLKMTVVGTFADQESKCNETRSEKNDRLKQLLQPFEKQLIPRSKSEVIFPVNAKSAGQGENEDPVANELRKVIQKLAPRLRMRFPLLWYFLEMELRRLGQKIVTKSECWEIARKLGFESKEALEATLRYLHEANIFLYYPDVLSNTIFVDPQAVLSNITKLYERHINLEDAPQSEVIREDDLRYRDQALFTANALISLDTDYSRAAFPNEDLITLLQHRLIISEMPFSINGETAYMMPSLLEALKEGDIIRPKTTAASPLIISFQEGWAPTGLFCALVVSLLSRKSKLPWKISEPVSRNMTKLYKNYLEFSIGHIAGSITLVNTMKQFELHPSSEHPSDLLPLTWQTIDQALKEACSKYSYKLSHYFTFECSCGVFPTHTARISVKDSTVQCTRDSGKQEPLSSKQKLWVLLQSEYAGSHEVEMKEQNVQTEDSVEKQGYLRGVEVIDHTSFTYTDRAQSFNWRRFGFKMHFPDHALPPSVNECQLHIKASLSGQFQFQEDAEVVSGIYWIASPHTFVKPVTVEIQHCVTKPELLQHPSSLTFIVAKCTQEDLPYQFKILDGGVFSPSSRYGSIKLTHFSGVGTAFRSLRRPSLIQRLGRRARQHESDAKSYCARLYYSSSGIHSWEVYFAITWDLELHIKAIDAKYAEAAAVVGPDQEVMFEEEQITLDIPKKGLVLESGWTITPHTYPGITKKQVDKFVPGCRVPSCQLHIKWTRQQEPPPELEHTVELQGAKEPFNFFLISLPVLQASSQGLSQQTPIFISSRNISIQQSLGSKYAGLESEPQLPDLMNEVASKVPAKWKQISIQLGLTPSDQECFMASTPNDPIQCFTSVFRVWKSRATRLYTWSTVIEALESPAVDEIRLAHELRMKLQS